MREASGKGAEGRACRQAIWGRRGAAAAGSRGREAESEEARKELCASTEKRLVVGGNYRHRTERERKGHMPGRRLGTGTYSYQEERVPTSADVRAPTSDPRPTISTKPVIARKPNEPAESERIRRQHFGRSLGSEGRQRRSVRGRRAGGIKSRVRQAGAGAKAFAFQYLQGPRS